MAQRLARILLADPYEVLRLGIRDILSADHGYDVVAEASDGLEAMQASQDLQPDMVIVEHAMPSLNGLDLTRRIKSKLPGCKVIAYTSCFTDELIVDYIKSGARGMVLKIDDREELLAAAKKVQLGKPYFSSSISHVLVEKLTHPQESEPSALTPRERQIVQLISEGQLNKQVAFSLGISTKTVETHRAAVMAKLQLVSVCQLVRYAIRNNLVAV